MTTERISATRVVPTGPADTFAVLADPSTHAAIDGTGWVTHAVDDAPLSGVGQLFTMGMHHDDHPGGAYETVNEITAYEPGRVIAWRTGHQEPGRDVTLTYDWSAVGPEPRTYLDFPPFPTQHLTDSLHHLETLATGGRKEPR